MDDGEIDFSDQEFFKDFNFAGDVPGTASMESFLDELLKGTHTCTHMHTCNPPGPDNTHTHTCFHTHTQIFAGPAEENSGDEAENQSDPSATSRKKRSSGNREAVRKYREKKKAHTAYLEEQVIQLKTLNQQLIKRLQGQVALKAEVLRLRTVLSEFRGRIDGELGSYPYQKPCPRSASQKGEGSFLHSLPDGYLLNSVTLPCDADVPCLHQSSGEHKESNNVLLEQTQALRSSGMCNLNIESCPIIMADNSGIQDGGAFTVDEGLH